MKKKILILFSLCLFVVLPTTAQTLKDAIGNDFLIGVTMNRWQVDGKRPQAADIVKAHFNAIVAENCMKPASIEPHEGVFLWDDADRLVQFGEANGLTVIGHCLLWHSQTAPWMFALPTQEEGGQDSLRSVMIRRMHDYITTVVGRYRGRVHGWDVINEAFLDNGEVRPSPWYIALGDDYFELAFRFAHEADPDAELYYNDYSMALPKKRDAVCRMVRRLKAKGCRIDAVGMQSHLGLHTPSLDDYEATMDSLVACGVKVGITELDVSVLPDPREFHGAETSQHFDYEKRMDPFRNGLDEATTQLFEQRYCDLFRLYRKHREHICRVNLWGVSDGESWLNNFPVRGRTNYPLLFDRAYQEKPVVKKIMQIFR